MCVTSLYLCWCPRFGWKIFQSCITYGCFEYHFPTNSSASLLKYPKCWGMINPIQSPYSHIYIYYLKPRSSTFCWWFSQFSPYFIHVADGFPIFVQPSARSGCHETWQLLNQNPQKFSAAQTSERWWLDHESAPGSRKSDLCIKIYAYTHTHTHIYVCVSVLVYMHIIVCVYIYIISLYIVCVCCIPIYIIL